MYQIKGTYASALITIDNLDSEAVTQLYGLLNARAAEGSRVAIMPDGHPGKDCLVGFTQRFAEDAEIRSGSSRISWAETSPAESLLGRLGRRFRI